MPRGGQRLRGANGEMNLIGAHVLARRKALGMTRNTMIARIAYITEGQWTPGTADLARIEEELRAVHTTELLVLCEVLKVTPGEIIGHHTWSDLNNLAEV